MRLILKFKALVHDCRIVVKFNISASVDSEEPYEGDGDKAPAVSRKLINQIAFPKT